MQLIRMPFLLLFGLMCANVNAQSYPDNFTHLRVVGNPSSAGEALVARVEYGGCPPVELPGDTQLTIQGAEVTLTLSMMVPPGGIACLTPPPRPYDDADFALGSFNPGSYTLNFVVISTYPGVTYPPLTTTFTVGAARSIPTLSSNMLIVMMLAVGASGLALRMRSFGVVS